MRTIVCKGNVDRLSDAPEVRDVMTGKFCQLCRF